MFSFLRGKVASKHINTPFGTFVVLDVGNIGYSVQVNGSTLAQLPVEGEETTLHTQLIHKEDNMYLCGFLHAQERDLFNFLRSVSGIGVKVALNILNERQPLEVISAVVKQDHKALAKTKGVGPKMAQRIILELKDKMVNWRPQFETQSSTNKEFSQLESYIEAESVMLSLGYSSQEIQTALAKALEDLENKEDTEQLLVESLKLLSQ